MRELRGSRSAATVPNPADPPFELSLPPALPKAQEICREEMPPLVHHGSPALAACHLPND